MRKDDLQSNAIFLELLLSFFKGFTVAYREALKQENDPILRRELKKLEEDIQTIKKLKGDR